MSGLTRLETVRVSRAAADQRRGRAGRTEPGVCYRLWDEPQTASLEAYTRPEILSADLSGFVLDLAQWGAADPATLAFLDAAAGGGARRSQGAADRARRHRSAGPHHRRRPQAAALPLPPRLARMVVDAGAEGAGDTAAKIAAVLTERGLGGDDVDLTHRLDQFRRDRSRRGEEARAMAKRWASLAVRAARKARTCRPASMLALAYPDRIAKNRGGGGGFLLANGRGGAVDAASALAREPFLAVAELTGAAAPGRIVLAAPITLAEIEARFADKNRGARGDHLRCRLRLAARAALTPAGRARADRADQAGQTRRRNGAHSCRRVLSPGPRQTAVDQGGAAMARPREFLRRAEGDEWPDLSDDALPAPPPNGSSRCSQTKPRAATSAPMNSSDALMNLLPWNLRKRLEAEAPTHFTAPSGSSVPIDYDAEEGPTVSIRVQELFGLAAIRRLPAAECRS